MTLVDVMHAVLKLLEADPAAAQWAHALLDALEQRTQEKGAS